MPGRGHDHDAARVRLVTRAERARPCGARDASGCGRAHRPRAGVSAGPLEAALYPPEKRPTAPPVAPNPRRPGPTGALSPGPAADGRHHGGPSCRRGSTHASRCGCPRPGWHDPAAEQLGHGDLGRGSPRGLGSHALCVESAAHPHDQARAVAMAPQPLGRPRRPVADHGRGPARGPQLARAQHHGIGGTRSRWARRSPTQTGIPHRSHGVDCFGQTLRSSSPFNGGFPTNVVTTRGCRSRSTIGTFASTPGKSRVTNTCCWH